MPGATRRCRSRPTAFSLQLKTFRYAINDFTFRAALSKQILRLTVIIIEARPGRYLLPLDAAFGERWKPGKTTKSRTRGSRDTKKVSPWRIEFYRGKKYVGKESCSSRESAQVSVFSPDSDAQKERKPVVVEFPVTGKHFYVIRELEDRNFEK